MLSSSSTETDHVKRALYVAVSAIVGCCDSDIWDRIADMLDCANQSLREADIPWRLELVRPTRGTWRHYHPSIIVIGAQEGNG
jgi:hypothetical protein